MREIKFKQAIWHPITGAFHRWHYWGLINGTFVGIDTGWYSPVKAIKNSYQYTERKDKNGKEIYEGDTLLTPGKQKLQVCLTSIAEGDAKFRNIGISNCEVIGNIYEHSYLTSNDREKGGKV